MQPFMRRYLWEFGSALAFYAVVLPVSILALKNQWVTVPWSRTLVSLSPMVPVGLACWAVLRNLRRIDEMQLRVQFEALGFAFAATGLLSLAYGFLENVGFPRLSFFIVWPCMGLLWVVGLQLAHRRYR